MAVLVVLLPAPPPAVHVLHRSNSPLTAALLLLADSYEVVIIDDLGDGCLYAFDTPLQPGDVQAELLPQHMKSVLFQPPGSISRVSGAHRKT